MTEGMEYIKTTSSTDFILDQLNLPVFVEQQVLMNLDWFGIVPQRQAGKGGLFDIVVKEPGYDEWKEIQNTIRAGETSDFVETRGKGSKWSVDKTGTYKYKTSYTVKEKNNDTAGKIPTEIGNMANFIADNINNQIKTKIIDNSVGPVPSSSDFNWVDQPIQALAKIKVFYDQTNKRYNATDIILSNEAYDEYVAKIYDKDYHMSFNRSFGYGRIIELSQPEALQGTEMPLHVLNNNRSKSEMGGYDYFLIDRNNSFGALYSDLSSWGFSPNVSAISKQGNFPICTAWESTFPGNETNLSTYVLSDIGFGMLRPSAIGKGNLTT
jgi:hypothetical protein